VAKLVRKMGAMWSEQRVKRWTGEDSDGKTLDVELTAGQSDGGSAEENLE
jgi:hypothetical protein